MMKKILFFFAIIQAAFGCEAIWHNGPTQLLKDIFAIMDISGVENLETASQQANFRWNRPKNLERWDVYSLLDQKQRKALSKKIKGSALSKEKMPLKKYYDVVVVLGSETSRAKSRNRFFKHLCNRGISFGKIYLLGSTRDLKIGSIYDVEMAEVLEAKGIMPTEMAMINEIWEQVLNTDALKKIPVERIQTGQRPDGTRASTEDTLEEMVKNSKDVDGKSFLFISNNPYIVFQDAVAKKILKSYKIEIETVGEGIRNENDLDQPLEEERVENVLDSIAKCLTNTSRL